MNLATFHVQKHKQLGLFVVCDCFPLCIWPFSHLGQATSCQTCASHIWRESGLHARKPQHERLPTMQHTSILHAFNILYMHNQLVETYKSCSCCNMLYNDMQMSQHAARHTGVHHCQGANRCPTTGANPVVPKAPTQPTVAKRPSYPKGGCHRAAGHKWIAETYNTRPPGPPTSADLPNMPR